MVNISLRVLSRPDASMLPAIYRQLGTDYDERVLPSICNEVSIYFDHPVRAVVDFVLYSLVCFKMS